MSATIVLIAGGVFLVLVLLYEVEFHFSPIRRWLERRYIKKRAARSSEKRKP